MEVTSQKYIVGGLSCARNVFFKTSSEAGLLIPMLQMRTLRHRKVVYLPRVTQLLGGKARIETVVHSCPFTCWGEILCLYNPVSTRCLMEARQAARRWPSFQKPLAVAVLVCPPADCSHAATTVEVPSLSGQVGAKTTANPHSLYLKQPLEFHRPGSGSLHSSQAVMARAKSTVPFQAIK